MPEELRPLRVRQGGAFSVNRVGGSEALFPLAFNVTETAGVFVMSGAAAQACELMDLITAAAQEWLLILDVGHHDYEPGGGQASLAAVAAEAGVRATVHDIRWATLTPSLPADELAVVARDDLARLLDDLPLYNIQLLDTAGEPGDDELEQLVLAARTAAADGPPLLASLPGSRLRFDGHDDCYFWVETRDPALPARLMARVLGLLAGTALLDGRDDVVVTEPPGDLIGSLLAESGQWTGAVTSRSESALTIGLEPERWRLGDEVAAHPARVLTYAVPSGTWS